MGSFQSVQQPLPAGGQGEASHLEVRGGGRGNLHEGGGQVVGAESQDKALHGLHADGGEHDGGPGGLPHEGGVQGLPSGGGQ